jgi:hypothetical protein
MNPESAGLPKVFETVLSYVALLPGQDTNGTNERVETVKNMSEIKAERVKSIEGCFTLLPLPPEWPAALKNGFGSPGPKLTVNKRYFHSYDQ